MRRRADRSARSAKAGSAARARLVASLAAVLLALPLGGAPAVSAARRGEARGRSVVVLDGAPVAVRWSDGDSFRILSGPLRATKVRVVEYNTLETYGPVHRWGAWRPSELLAIARSTGKLAAQGRWRCRRVGGSDGYGRLLVSCPDAARALVAAGRAVVFAVDGAADPALLAAQRAAQQQRTGIWAKGAPPRIITSVHSAAEGRGYNRVVDARTGAAQIEPHERTFAVCEEVCVGAGPDASCLVYVPYERRYRNRPPCLLPGAGPTPAAARDQATQP